MSFITLIFYIYHYYLYISTDYQSSVICSLHNRNLFRREAVEGTYQLVYLRLKARATSTTILVLPASSEFSTSSFTTEAGRSTTSPAAILLRRDSESTVILDIGIFYHSGEELISIVYSHG
jgi:hypothetical protein